MEVPDEFITTKDVPDEPNAMLADFVQLEDKPFRVKLINSDNDAYFELK